MTLPPFPSAGTRGQETTVPDPSGRIMEHCRNCGRLSAYLPLARSSLRMASRSLRIALAVSILPAPRPTTVTSPARSVSTARCSECPYCQRWPLGTMRGETQGPVDLPIRRMILFCSLARLMASSVMHLMPVLMTSLYVTSCRRSLARSQACTQSPLRLCRRKGPSRRCPLPAPARPARTEALVLHPAV